MAFPSKRNSSLLKGFTPVPESPAFQGGDEWIFRAFGTGFHPEKPKKPRPLGRGGFTLIELMMVMAILVLLIVASLPQAFSFYRTRQLDVYENGLVQTLRRAQLKSMSVESDSSFGVYISSNQYVLFKGGSYMAREAEFDEISDFPNGLLASGLSEVVFMKLSGAPSNTGNIILTSNNQPVTININEAGRINY